MNIRKNVEKILTLHRDKEPEILARMVVAYLAADDVISVGNGALEDDDLYDSDDSDESDEDEETDVLRDDYASIGVKLCKLGKSYY